ncbi:hypothetical protein SLS56_000251 [Neofusicoccum ribis]|uniref:Uncharacterized protein n=1 Tax=Neofusicoccum ribis TaxID=45134 RepID=A0ABR3TG51_9PEZI
MDEVKNSGAVRFRDFDAKLERISGQKCDVHVESGMQSGMVECKAEAAHTAKPDFAGDGHVHFKGENVNVSKTAPPVGASSNNSGEKAGAPPG